MGLCPCPAPSCHGHPPCCSKLLKHLAGDALCPHCSTSCSTVSRHAAAEPSAPSHLEWEQGWRTARSQVLPALLLAARPGQEHHTTTAARPSLWR